MAARKLPDLPPRRVKEGALCPACGKDKLVSYIAHNFGNETADLIFHHISYRCVRSKMLLLDVHRLESELAEPRFTMYRPKD